MRKYEIIDVSSYVEEMFSEWPVNILVRATHTHLGLLHGYETTRVEVRIFVNAQEFKYQTDDTIYRADHAAVEMLKRFRNDVIRKGLQALPETKEPVVKLWCQLHMDYHEPRDSCMTSLMQRSINQIDTHVHATSSRYGGSEE